MTQTGLLLFVTGTDTGVGKTVLAAALARAFGDRGRRVGVLKPIETGWPDRATDPAAPRPDGEALRAAARDPEPLEAIVPVRLPDPLAPLLAAERAGIEIDGDDLARRIEEKRARCDLLVVEGAGGLLVPIAARFGTLDLVVRTGAPVLVVAANRLGVINHAALTLACLDAARVPVAGLALNRVADGDDLARSLNPGYLARSFGARYLGELPWQGCDAPVERVAAALERALDLDSLWARLVEARASRQR